MSNITRKHITFKIGYKGVEYPVYIPFVKYEMFKDIYLVFSYVYELFKNQGLDPYSFCKDIEAHIEVAIKTKYKGIDFNEKKKAVDRFFEQSLMATYVLDTKNDYEPILLDKFLKDDEEESEDFFMELRGMFCLFYICHRYVKVELMTEFKDFYTSLSVTELKKSFMKSSSQETSTQETENTQESSVSAKTINLAGIA
ncbi:hypothetical protein [Helicobacter bilis]|uniref:hypothetical protein n=1 Tax=Helicobacter bilis TaxID=37372 RepID=UPI0025AA135A|nr:hypothetical protein [Helicobacter bilis]